jgi:hypothetical protein
MTYSNNFEKIKWDHKEVVMRQQQKRRKTGINIIRDVDPFKSPIDGSIIGSRRDLREHEKKHNVRQVGNDWTGSSRPPNWDSIKNGRS